MRVKKADCEDWRMGGTEKNHKSEEGDLVPVRKGRVEDRVEDGDRGRSEDGQAVRANERRQTNNRMRESKVRQEITGYRRGLVREGELTGQV